MGADIEQAGWQGMPPIVYAAELKDEDLFNYLIKKGAKTHRREILDVKVFPDDYAFING